MQLVITGDGSHTIRVPQLNEHYHSTFGAIAESMHVFIKAGMDTLPANEAITVLEIGFGTGLNALLACLATVNSSRAVTYYGLELNPVPYDLICGLNYPELLSPEHNPQELFRAIHQSPWDQPCFIHDHFQLTKIHQSLIGFQPDFTYDLIFFDAFAPEKQIEMWTAEIFTMLYKGLKSGGIMTTYCVKGEVKRMIKQAGFNIEKLPGPPGKREILRGRRM
jgi:tRNA U34 5-methylaminomethyl-2-thiouridine-forming methyltransferase MnmC